MTPDRSLTMACALVFFTPVAGVLAGRFVGSAVTTAEASYVETAVPPAVTLPPLSDRVDRAETLAVLASPFRSIDEAVIREASDPGDPNGRVTHTPGFALTAVMPHPRRPIAVINGRPRTVGEELASGWTLVDIDGGGRTVVIQGPDGTRVRVRMGSQGEGR